MILGSVIFRGTFRRISQLWDNTHTLTFPDDFQNGCSSRKGPGKLKGDLSS